MSEVPIFLDFTDEELQKIDELRVKLKLKNNTEVIAYAVSLLIKIDEAKEKGDKIQFKQDAYNISGSITTFDY